MSQDHATALQPGDRARLCLKTKNKKTQKITSAGGEVEKVEPCALLVGTRDGTDAMENGMITEQPRVCQLSDCWKHLPQELKAGFITDTSAYPHSLQHYSQGNILQP